MVILWIHKSSGLDFFARFESKKDAYYHTKFLISKFSRMAHLTMLLDDVIICKLKNICVAASNELQFIIVEDDDLPTDEGTLIEVEDVWLDIILDTPPDDIFFTATDNENIVKLDSYNTSKAACKRMGIIC